MALTLYPFQTRAVGRLYEMERALIDAPLGSGKSVIGARWLELAAMCARARHQLVVAPMRVLQHVWRPLLRDEFPDAKLVNVTSKSPFRPERGRWTIGLMSNRVLRTVLHTRKNTAKSDQTLCQALIVDEATTVTTGTNAAALRAWLKLVAPRFRLAMTGTPFARGHEHAWALYAIVAETMSLGFASKTAYMRETHFDVAPRHLNFPIWKLRPGMAAELAKRAAPITLRVIPTFPELPQTTSTERIVMSPDARAEYERLCALITNDAGMPLANGVKVQALRQWCQTQKRADLKRWIGELSEPAIVWIEYRRDRAAVHEAAKAAGIVSADVGKRHALATWTKRKLDVLVAHPAEAGHGLNLQSGGRLMLWYTPPWSLELYDQGVGRLRRRGQKHTVHVARWAIAGTVEDDVLEALDARRDVADAMREYFAAAA